MPRKAKGPRLYLDPGRKQWVIRDGGNFIRTGRGEEEVGAAEADLIKYRANNWQRSTGFIYFLTAAHPDFPIKIGFTGRMANLRIRALQNACPYAVYFIGHVPGTMVEERELHHAFDHLRLHGEWFRNTPELRAYINGMCPVQTKEAV
jgi:hypothetical protein